MNYNPRARRFRRLRARQPEVAPTGAGVASASSHLPAAPKHRPGAGQQKAAVWRLQFGAGGVCTDRRPKPQTVVNQNLPQSDHTGGSFWLTTAPVWERKQNAGAAGAAGAAGIDIARHHSVKL